MTIDDISCSNDILGTDIEILEKEFEFFVEYLNKINNFIKFTTNFVRQYLIHLHEHLE